MSVGIKIVHHPIMPTRDWDTWESGYIEGFVRTSVNDEPDYFIWTYIRMEHLQSILEKYQEHFRYYKLKWFIVSFQ